MRFVPKSYDAVHGSALVFVPTDVTEADASLQDRGFVEVDIVGYSRMVSARVIRMMARFSLEAAERSRLRHDCVVFALACATGNPCDGLDFVNGYAVGSASTVVYPSPEDVAHLSSPPEVVVTSAAPPESRLWLNPKALPHYMVPATPWGEQPQLYASKLSDEEPAALHGLTALEAQYPIRTIAVMSGLRMVEL